MQLHSSLGGENPVLTSAHPDQALLSEDTTPANCSENSKLRGHVHFTDPLIVNH
jgi:hypothetical protein